MILVSTETVPGKDIQALGLVKGSTIQTKNIGRDITVLKRWLAANSKAIIK